MNLGEDAHALETELFLKFIIMERLLFIVGARSVVRLVNSRFWRKGLVRGDGHVMPKLPSMGALLKING